MLFVRALCESRNFIAGAFVCMCARWRRLAAARSSGGPCQPEQYATCGTLMSHGVAYAEHPRQAEIVEEIREVVTYIIHIFDKEKTQLIDDYIVLKLFNSYIKLILI